VALVARAFGARGVFIDGYDESLVNKVRKTVEYWGGSYFEVRLVSDPKGLVRQWRENGGKVIHLTMYGINLPEVENRIREIDNLLIVVGSEKVEGWYYTNADFNVAVSNQPHSEVAALAILLDRLYKGDELNIVFRDAKIRIIPQERGKKVIRTDEQ
jgi:tRNA (cytidine56-2'-O)-methyltransferase